MADLDLTSLWEIMAAVSVCLLLFLWWQRKLKSLHEKISSYLEIIDGHVLNCNLDLNGNMVDVSDALCRTSGYSAEELVGKNFTFFWSEETSELLGSLVWSTVTADLQWHGEEMNLCKDGSPFWTETMISPHRHRSKVQGYMVVRQDITDKKRVEKLTITDELTQLYNRRHFKEVFPAERNRSKRDGHFFAFMLIDIDFFKKYNDTYGHHEGDVVLTKVGELLNHILKRSGDFPFRLGGEEFGCIVSVENREDVDVLAEKIRQGIVDLNIEHKENSPYNLVTISTGVQVLGPKDNISLDEVYQSADKALYRAKDSGRNKTVHAVSDK